MSAFHNRATTSCLSLVREIFVHRRYLRAYTDIWMTSIRTRMINARLDLRHQSAFRVRVNWPNSQ